MTPDQLQKEIERLSKKLEELETVAFKFHKHTGLDSQKVLFTDLDRVLYNESTINPSSLADGAGETQQITIEGANLGDFVLVSTSYDLEDITVTGYVQSQDTVEIRIQNESGGTVNLGSGTWRALVIKKPN